MTQKAYRYRLYPTLGLARISHKFSGNSHTLSPDLHRQDSEAVLTQHCPRYSDDGSQITERRFSPKICEKCGLGRVFKIFKTAF